MKAKPNTLCRILSMFLAFSLIPALVSGSQNDRKFSHDSLIPLSEAMTSVDSGIDRFPTAIIAAELFRDNTTRISRSHTTRRSGHPEIMQFCLVGSIFLLAAAYILVVLIRRRNKRRNSSLSFIIRYIHDQDGYKSPGLFY